MVYYIKFFNVKLGDFVKVVIVDDDIIELEKTKALVDRYFENETNIIASVECYSDPQLFMNRFVFGDRADLYILDIIMPGVNGISLGQKIKDTDRNASVVYLTTSRDFAVESYGLKAKDYIIKPCAEDRLFNTMEEVFNAKKQEHTKRFLVKMQDGTCFVPHSEILYTEYYEHHLIIHTTDGKRIDSINHRESFSVLAEPLLKEKNFIRISASYVINMEYVKKIRANEFEMKNGTKLPISRSFPDSRSSYMNYILGD